MKKISRINFLILLILLLTSKLFAQHEGGEFIYKYVTSISPITMTDEGDMRAERQYKIDWIKKGYPCFFLPSSKSNSARCISGDCINGKGIVEYPSIKARYEGWFKASYPDSLGVLINRKGIRLNTFMEKGSMKGMQNFDLNTRTIDPLGFSSSVGNIDYVKNIYWPKYDLYYSGGVNKKITPRSKKENFVRGERFRGKVGYFNNDGSVSTFIGEYDYNQQYIFEGKLSSKFKFLSGKFIDKNNGTIIEPKFAKDGSGEIYYLYVKITKGDTIYVGQTNKDFIPHGQGVYQIKGTNVDIAGNFENGKYIDPYKKQKEILVQKQFIEDNRYKIIKAINKHYGVDGYRGYLYKGIPNGWFSIKANNSIEANPYILIFNLSSSDKHVCLKPAIKHFRKICVDLPPYFNYSNGKININPKGIKKIGIELPRLNETFNITVNGASNSFYVIVKY
jgi:hypothetical protein